MLLNLNLEQRAPSCLKSSPPAPPSDAQNAAKHPLLHLSGNTPACNSLYCCCATESGELTGLNAEVQKILQIFRGSSQAQRHSKAVLCKTLLTTDVRVNSARLLQSCSAVSKRTLSQQETEQTSGEAWCYFAYRQHVLLRYCSTLLQSSRSSSCKCFAQACELCVYLDQVAPVAQLPFALLDTHAVQVESFAAYASCVRASAHEQPCQYQYAVRLGTQISSIF